MLRHSSLGLLARAFSLHANVAFADALYPALAEQLPAPKSLRSIRA